MASNGGTPRAQGPTLHALLGAGDLDAPDLHAILDLADRLRDAWPTPPRTLEGRAVALVFEKPSLRTRASFEIGLTRLGAHAVYLDQSSSPLGERESVADFTRTLERYADAIIARVRRHATLERMAGSARVPVVNALSDREHPCQALGDAMTIRAALGRVRGVQVAFVGDANNVCNSLLLTLGALGAHVVVLCPPSHGPAGSVLDAARTRATAAGGSVEQVHEPEDLASMGRFDVVYTDTWVSMGSEHERETRLEAFGRFRVTEHTMRAASGGGDPPLFMHCLPASRGVEVDDAVIDGPTSVVYDQAENRMHAQNALMSVMLGGAQGGGDGR